MTAFQLDETLDERAVRRQLFGGQHGEEEKRDEEEDEQAALLDSGSSKVSDAARSPSTPPARASSPPSTETPPPPTAATVFAQRVFSAHMRNYAKSVYAAVRQSATRVPLRDAHVALNQCAEYSEELDLSAIQVEEEDTTHERWLDLMHELLQQMLTSDFQRVGDMDVYVYCGKEEQSPTPSSILSSMQQSMSAEHASTAHAIVGRAEDDDSKGEMRAYPLPLFLQLKGVVRPVARPASLFPSSPTPPSSPSSPPAARPLQMETIVTADTDLTRLSTRMLRYQQPDWWLQLQQQRTAEAKEEDKAPHTRSHAGVQCVLLIKAWTLPPYSERQDTAQPQPTEKEQRESTATPQAPRTSLTPEQTPRSLQAASPPALYSQLPTPLRVVMLRAYQQLQVALTGCLTAL
jgi:hypothetical protein